MYMNFANGAEEELPPTQSNGGVRGLRAKDFGAEAALKPHGALWWDEQTLSDSGVVLRSACETTTSANLGYRSFRSTHVTAAPLRARG